MYYRYTENTQNYKQLSELSIVYINMKYELLIITVWETINNFNTKCYIFYYKRFFVTVVWKYYNGGGYHSKHKP